MSRRLKAAGGGALAFLFVVLVGPWSALSFDGPGAAVAGAVIDWVRCRDCSANSASQKNGDEPPEAVCSALLDLTSAIDAAYRKEQDAERNARTEQERRIAVASRLESDAGASDDAAGRLEAVAVGTTSTWASSVKAAAGDLRQYSQVNRRVKKSLLALPADRSPTTLASLQELQDELQSALRRLASLEAIAEAADDSPDCRRLRTVLAEG